MNASPKKRVLCIFPGPSYRPNMIDFRGRFDLLSDEFEGEVYSWSCHEEHREIAMGSFVYRGLVFQDGNSSSKWAMAKHILKHAKAYHAKNPVDLIICYEPLFTGVIGALLKRKFKCKLIVELNNSNIAEAMTMEGGVGLKTRIKIWVSQMVRAFTLKHVDGIKLLTENQRGNLEQKYQHKNVVCFHDFVPTNFFKDAPKRMDPYILFVGYPYHRKGIDILMKAFEEIADEFPTFELHLVGHLLEEEARKRFDQWSDRIQFIKPMFYEELQSHFLNCYCFALPSREEGMGRVLLEAMSSGKAVIGCNVGGIPALVKHEQNGLLFEREDIQGLADCLRRVLKDSELTQRMGDKSLDVINQEYSSEKYVHFFKDMVRRVFAC